MYFSPVPSTSYTNTTPKLFNLNRCKPIPTSRTVHCWHNKNSLTRWTEQIWHLEHLSTVCKFRIVYVKYLTAKSNVINVVSVRIVMQVITIRTMTRVIIVALFYFGSVNKLSVMPLANMFPWVLLYGLCESLCHVGAGISLFWKLLTAAFTLVSVVFIVLIKLVKLATLLVNVVIFEEFVLILACIALLSPLFTVFTTLLLLLVQLPGAPHPPGQRHPAGSNWMIICESR